MKGSDKYLYRAVDSRGQTIDFLLSAKRDAEAAKRFFRKALAQPHTVNPRTISVDKNAAYPKATAAMKKDGEPFRKSTGRVASRTRAPAGMLIISATPRPESRAIPQSIESYHPCPARRAPRRQPARPQSPELPT